MKIFHSVILIRDTLGRPFVTPKYFTSVLAARHRSQVPEAATVTIENAKLKEEKLDSESHSKEFGWKLPEFENARVIYRNKSLEELLRAYMIFTACSFDILVNNQVKLLQLTRRLLGSWGFSWLLKKTLSAQFMAGMSREGLISHARRHSLSGIHPMFAYTASEVHGGATNPDSAASPGDSELGPSHKEIWFATNLNEISRSIQIAAECKDLSTTKPLVTTKLTFITHAELLEVFSRVVVEQSAALKQILSDESVGCQYKEDVMGFLVEMIRASEAGGGELPTVNIPKGDVVKNLGSLLTNTSFQVVVNQHLTTLESFQKGKKITKLSVKEINGIIRTWLKMKQLNELTVSNDVQLNYDAEQTYLQPAIESLVLDSMRQSNRSATHVLNTYQCYLKRTHDVISRDMELSRREGFYFGAKIVRGAYVDEETRLAKKHGYENPVNDSYDATSEMYERVTNTALDHCHSLPARKTRLVFATHNKDTVASVIKELKTRGMNPVQYGVSFAQLFGMRDFISFALGEAGYPAGKLIHYADPESGVAYLSRRLNENRSGLPSPRVERSLLLTEIKRRLLPYRRA